MRDPMSWSIPLFRAFGIQVKVHILYIVITLAMFLREFTKHRAHAADYALIWVVMLFVIVLLHEFGHCFAARRGGGEADEILMWPLGGLAFCAVPHTARANLITAVGGPFVNVLICLVAGAALFAAGYYPLVNVFQTRQLYYPELHNWQTGGEGVPYYSEIPFYKDTKTGNLVFSLKGLKNPNGGPSYAVTEDGKLVEVEAPVIEAYAP